MKKCCSKVVFDINFASNHCKSNGDKKNKSKQGVALSSVQAKIDALTEDEKEVVESLEYLYRGSSYYVFPNGVKNDAWKYKLKIIGNHADLIFKNLEIFDKTFQSNILSIIKTVSPEVFYKEENKKILKDYIIKKVVTEGFTDKKEGLLLADIITSRDPCGINFYSKNEYQKLFETIYLEKNMLLHNEKAIPFIRRFCRIIFANFPETIAPHIKSGSFTGGSKYFREAVYSAMIDEGKLTKKYARRLRSENVEDVSFRCINRMFKRENDYSPKDYKILCSQLVDVKHEKSAILVAKFLPESLLPFAVGLNSKIAKNILAERMSKPKTQDDEDVY